MYNYHQKKGGGAREQELGGYIMYNFADVYKYMCRHVKNPDFNCIIGYNPAFLCHC